MRILFVGPGRGITDTQGAHMPFVRREADALRSLGHEVWLHSFDNRDYTRFLAEWRELRALVRRLRPDVVHAQFGKFTALMAAFSGAPLVITFRGTDINRNARYGLLRSSLGILASQIAACFARGIVCVSREIRDKVWAAARRPSIVLPTGVDLREFRPMDRAAARARLGFAAGEKVVLFNAGRNPDVKDPDLAAAAVAGAGLKIENLRFVVLDGSAPPGDVPLYMNAADVLLLTSRSEGSPTVVQEAMACNLPVVSVDVGDVRERLEGVQASRVVGSRDPALLAAALVEILESPRRSDGRVHARALGSEAIAARLADFYRAVGAFPTFTERGRGIKFS
jgi:glycosyltransferase involved in cell wall biosynthesis